MTVNWGTGEITVFRTDMLQVQTTPVAIYQLNIIDFHDALRDEEATALGAAYPTTHKYASSVTISGTPLAPVVEILEPYTITFEDALYNVNIVGGNSNISDRNNKNTVGVNTSNSAGLQDLSSLQAASFGDVVAVDAINGTVGTTFPIGTKGTPAKTTADAITIAQRQNINQLYIIGNITLDTGDNVGGFIIYGQSAITTTITVNTGADTLNTEFRDCSIGGTLDGGAILRECLIGQLTYITGFLDRCGLGTFPITLGGGTQAIFIDCFSAVPGGNTPTIDMGGTGISLAIRGYSGGVKLINKHDSSPTSIDMASGQVIFDATVTNTNNIYVRGMARVTDNSTGSVEIDTVGLISGDRTVRSTGYVVVSPTGTPGTTPRQGTYSFPVDNIADAITIANINKVTKIRIQGIMSTAGTEDLSDFIVFGDSPTSSSFTVTAGTTTTNTTFRELNLSGALSSDGAVVERCQVGNLSGVQNYIYQSFLYGTVTMSGATTAAHCSIAPNTPSQKAYFDFNSLASTLIISDWGAGVAVFKNMITGSFAGASGTGGRVEIDALNTGGNIVYGGSLLLNPLNLNLPDDIKDSSVAGEVWNISPDVANKGDVYASSFL